MSRADPAGADLTGADLARDPLARRARKRPLPVAVEFATADGVLDTLEGPVRYRAGDALLTGVAGERWPVGRARFEATYEPEATCEPEAICEPLPPGAGGAAGRYRRRPQVVLARRMDEPFRVRVGHAADTLRGRPGDWLLQYGPADYGIVAADLFARSYELLDDGPLRPPSP